MVRCFVKCIDCIQTTSKTLVNVTRKIPTILVCFPIQTASSPGYEVYVGGERAMRVVAPRKRASFASPWGRIAVPSDEEQQC
jgi:hypothetical protein